MTSVAVQTARGNLGGHPHVVISGAGQSVVLDLTDPSAEFDNMAARWEQILRPNRSPVLVRTGGQLSTVQLEAVIGLDHNVDIGPRLAALTFIARNADSVTVGHTTPTGAPSSKKWVLTSARWRVLLRRHGDNAITRVRVTLELTEASNPFAAPTNPVPTPTFTDRPRVRRHAVREGESIWSIATTYYGSIEAWTRIADANNLVRLSPLRTGLVLTLP